MNRHNRSASATASTTEVTQETVLDPALVPDRTRIAVELHDTVIQRLFTTGLALHIALRELPVSPAADRIEDAIAVIDKTIKRIRATIFVLDIPDMTTNRLRAEVWQ